MKEHDTVATRIKNTDEKELRIAVPTGRSKQLSPRKKSLDTQTSLRNN
jgi:hypothetical protein